MAYPGDRLFTTIFIIARAPTPLLLLAAALACREPRAPGSPASLIAALERVRDTGAQSTRWRAVLDWQLDERQFAVILRPEYRALRDAYPVAFTVAARRVLDHLAHARTITVRRHYAGDPRLAPAEARDRWALPTLATSWVAEVDGAPLDAVFVADGAQWRSLLGLDAALQQRVAALDAACARRLAQAGPPGRCTEVGAMIASAALRNDSPQLAHACQLAQSLCGTESP